MLKERADRLLLYLALIGRYSGVPVQASEAVLWSTAHSSC